MINLLWHSDDLNLGLNLGNGQMFERQVQNEIYTFYT